MAGKGTLGSGVASIRAWQREQVGYQAHAELFALWASYQFVQRNLLALRAHLDTSIDGRDIDLGERREFFVEMARHFSNFLSAAVALRDHYDRLRAKQLLSDGVQEQLDDLARESFAGSLELEFLTNLRNSFMHRSSSFSEHRLKTSIGVTENSAHLGFLRESVLAWLDWNDRMTRYIEGMDEEIWVTDILKTYEARVGRFYPEVLTKAAIDLRPLFEEFDAALDERQTEELGDHRFFSHLDMSWVGA